VDGMGRVTISKP